MNQYGANSPLTDPKAHPPLQYDAAKDLFYFSAPGGTKVYIPPVNYKGQAQGSGHGMMASQGNYFKNADQFNALTGTIDPGGTNWLSVTQLVAAAVVSAGFATGVLGAPAAAVAGGVEAGATSGLGAAALPGAGTALGAGAAGVAGTAGAMASTAPVLEGLAAGPGAATLPAAAGGGAAAGAGGAFDAAGNFIGQSSYNLPAAASSGVPNWLTAAIGPVVGGLGQIYSANQQANANTDAAKIQADSIAKALAFAKEEYAAKVGALTPYISAGTTSSDRINQLLGLPARQGTTTTGPGSTLPPTAPAPPGGGFGPNTSTAPPAPPVGTPGTYQPGSPNDPNKPLTTSPVTAPASATQTGQMVLMAEPGGTQKAVPASEVPHWLSVGATLVNQAPAGNQYANGGA